MGNTLSVGLGEQAISRNPTDILVAYGLGSCLGIGMYDPVTHVAGLAHAVLPENSNGTDPNPGKFVDTGIKLLIEQMVKAGANRNRLTVRMAGGANMLVSASLSKTFDIGSRNIQSAHVTFNLINMKIANEEVGGNTGRTVRMYVDSGRMTVRVIGGQEHDI